MTGKMKAVLAVLALTVSVSALSLAVAQHHRGGARGGLHARMHGDQLGSNIVPQTPGKSWILARGGLLYDNWWTAAGRRAPANTHPSYPKSGKKSGANTWRCKECHGWDYKGKDGRYAKGSHATGIVGIRAAQGRSLKEISTLLRGSTHAYTADMIGDDDLARIAAFVSRGQHDTDKLIDAGTGDVRPGALSGSELLKRGQDIFQTTCAVCHGYDGRRLNFGTRQKPAFVGTEAKANPWEVLHKIRNAHPGVEMISLRAFPINDAAAALAYARTLPEK